MNKNKRGLYVILRREDVTMENTVITQYVSLKSSNTSVVEIREGHWAHGVSSGSAIVYIETHFEEVSKDFKVVDGKIYT